jgi:hypothetical protein
MARCVQILGAVTCAVAWTTAGHTQPADVIIEVSECISLENDLERYACYERLTAQALEGETQQDSAATIPDTTQATEVVAPAEIRSSIAAIEVRRRNRHVITLENGQVWRQSLAKRYPLRVGQEVRIYSTRWGDSSRLSAIESNGFIQVERIE